jgi:hypothetical protein
MGGFTINGKPMAVVNEMIRPDLILDINGSYP